MLALLKQKEAVSAERVHLNAVIQLYQYNISNDVRNQVFIKLDGYKFHN